MLVMLALSDRLVGRGEGDLRDGDCFQYKHVTAELLADPPMAEFIARECQSDVERAVLEAHGVVIDDLDRIHVEHFTPAALGSVWRKHARWDLADPEQLNLGAVIAYWRLPA